MEFGFSTFTAVGLIMGLLKVDSKSAFFLEGPNKPSPEPLQPGLQNRRMTNRTAEKTKHHHPRYTATTPTHHNIKNTKTSSSSSLFVRRDLQKLR